MPERELLIHLHVTAQAVPLIVRKLREASYKAFERCRWVNVYDVIGIHLQSVLYSVRVYHDTEYG
jgi:predicted RNA-binding protein with EMAP domain